jgi:hypothetical protein
MKVTCSVVTGSDPGAITEFLRSLSKSVAFARTRRPDLVLETTVVVNGKFEPTVPFDGSEALFIKNHTPLGFAANHNQVLRTTRAAYHLLANDDIVVDEDTISALLDYMENPANDKVGALTPRLLNPDGSLQPSTYSFPTVPAVVLAWLGIRNRLPAGVATLLSRAARRGEGRSRMWAHDRELDVETFRGAFVLMRMEAVRDVGLMTEVALVGGEESDWHKRLEDRGWRRVFNPSTSAIHIGRLTTGGRLDLEPEYVKGVTNFFAAHAGRWSFWLIRTLAIVRTYFIARQYRRANGDRLPRYGSPVNRIRYGGHPVEGLVATTSPATSKQLVRPHSAERTC